MDSTQFCWCFCYISATILQLISVFVWCWLAFYSFVTMQEREKRMGAWAGVWARRKGTPYRGCRIVSKAKSGYIPISQAFPSDFCLNYLLWFDWISFAMFVTRGGGILIFPWIFLLEPYPGDLYTTRCVVVLVLCGLFLAVAAFVLWLEGLHILGGDSSPGAKRESRLRHRDGTAGWIKK